MPLNVWSTNWRGHIVEVRNYWFSAELCIDAVCVDKAGGVFGCELRGVIADTGPERPSGSCSNTACYHRNKPEAVFCANCGATLVSGAATHQVRVSVSQGLTGLVCRVFVDGLQVLKEGSREQE